MSNPEVTRGDDSQASSSGVDAEVSAQSDDASGRTEDKVAYSSYQKALSEKRNFRSRAQELEAKLAEYEQKDLEHKQKYEALWKQAEEKASARERELLNLRTQIETQRKNDALRAEMTKLGLNPQFEAKALQLADTSSVVFDEEHGVLGGEEVARKLRDEFPMLFQQKVPGVSQKAPAAVGGVGKPLSELSQAEIIQQLRSLS